MRHLIAAAMDRWHAGPSGGTCPRTDGPQCSVYGAAAVRRYGALLGVLAAARYVTGCVCDVEYERAKPGKWAALTLLAGPEDPPPFGCRFGPPNPDRWALLDVLLAFARIGLFGQAPPGRNCLRERRGEDTPTRG